MPHTLSDRFEIRERLGHGAMGEVHAGWDRRDERPVAIKRLHGAVRHDQAALDRFRREAALLRAAAHPNIVQVLAVVESPEGPCIVMEHVPGGTLEHELERTPQLPIPRVLTLALDLADALARAHRIGVVHRDVKPANVLLDAHGVPRLSDFGVAFVGDGTRLTEHGAVIGTMAYLAPEAWEGAAPDARTDVWSLGVLLYEALAGRRPFTGASPVALMGAIFAGEVAPLRSLRPEVPPALADAVHRMLEREPARRMSSVRELGVVAERLLAGDVVAPVPAETGAAVALPRFATPLIGRDREVAELARRLVAARGAIVTVTGPGGSGKTRVAVAAASQAAAGFPDGVVWVDLTGVADAALVLPTIAKALAVEEDLYRPIEDLLAERLAAARLLLVLDNFEQVVDAAPALAALLSRTAAAVACVTSRALLRVREEHEFTVGPFGLPADARTALPDDHPAMQLFEERARAADARFALGPENRAAVSAICRRLDGLPLAIELAAARARVLPPARLLDYLEQPLAVLTSGGRDRPTHQRTLQATIEWSARLLPPEVRTLFDRLGVFVGPVSLEEVEAVLVGADSRTFLPDVVDGLQVLVEHSLLVVHDEGADRRYTMLETVRAFARESLRASGGEGALAAAHARAFAELAARWQERVPTAEQALAMTALGAVHADLRAALGWAAAHDRTLELRLVVALARFWFLGGHWLEALGWYTRALEATPDGDPDLRARLLDELGRLEMYLGDERAALVHHEQALASSTGAPPALRARVREGLAEVLLKVGDVPRAMDLLAVAEQEARVSGDPNAIAEVFATYGAAHVGAGGLDEGERLLGEARTIATARGHRFLLTKVLYALAGIALLRGDAARAGALAEEGQAVARDSGDASWAWHVDEMLGRALAELGEHARAEALVLGSLHALQAVGSRPCLPHSLEAVARLRLTQGDSRPVAHLLGAADAYCQRLQITMLPVERALYEQCVARAKAVVSPEEFGSGWDAGGALDADAAIAAASGRPG